MTVTPSGETKPETVLVIGAAGFTFPRDAANFPGVRRVDAVDVDPVVHEGLVLGDCRGTAQRKRDCDSFGQNRPGTRIRIARRLVVLDIGTNPMPAIWNVFDLLKIHVGQFVALVYTSHANLEDTG